MISQLCLQVEEVWEVFFPAFLVIEKSRPKMFRMICRIPQSVNSKNVKYDLVVFDIVDFGCVSEVFLVFAKQGPFKDGASCADGEDTFV